VGEIASSKVQGLDETLYQKADAKDVVALNSALLDKVEENYNTSVIAMNYDIETNTVTYITGDGESHSFTVQDKDTTYTLGTDETTGLTKLYAVTGSAEDGTMTQKAITTELKKKVGVKIDSTSDTLVFVI
jgi:hypothetical protein